jgi:hypothetical protein
MYMCFYVCSCDYIDIHRCIYVYIHVYICIYIYICGSWSLLLLHHRNGKYKVCICECIYILYQCMHSYFLSIFMCIWTCINACMYMYTSWWYRSLLCHRMHVDIYVYICMYVYMWIHAWICVFLYKSVHIGLDGRRRRFPSGLQICIHLFTYVCLL